MKYEHSIDTWIQLRVDELDVLAVWSVSFLSWYRVLSSFPWPITPFHYIRLKKKSARYTVKNYSTRLRFCRNYKKIERRLGSLKHESNCNFYKISFFIYSHLCWILYSNKNKRFNQRIALLLLVTFYITNFQVS